MRRLLPAILGVVLAVTGLSAVGAPSAVAVQTPQNRLVTDDPANFTPNVLDGKVLTIVQVGDQILLGGLFTQVKEAGTGTVFQRRNMVSFDARTGRISTSFVPDPDGEVSAIIPAGDGTIYVGGYFNNISGAGSPTLARINATTGARVTSFKIPKFDGRIKDLRLVGNRLWMAGYFTTVAGNAQTGLATVNATTGAFDSFMSLPIRGTHNGGTTTVMKMDVDPQGTRLVAIGNFTTVNGQRNYQIFMLDISGASAKLANWNTSFYTAACSRSFQSYMRDLDIDPEGRYFVVTTTGAYGGSSGPCDTSARFELGATGSGVTPTWVNYTGGDTTYAVAITGSVVYTGGHARWQNNPFAGDKAGAGAVSRPGIAALDPENGLPFSWNPTKERGVGVFDMLATDTGLWVGSDTDRVGPTYELRQRIAYFPLAGGKDIPSNALPTLPADVYVAGTGGQNVLNRRTFDGTTTGAPATAPTGGRSWNTVKGAFMLNGQLYTGWSNGTFTRQAFDGTTYGASVPVNTSDLLAPLTAWRTELRSMTGLFFHGGRVYFTRSGSSNLFYRYFTPESDVVGAQVFTASGNVTGINFSQVRGMFLAGDKLYWATSDGTLRRITFTNGRPVAGTAQTVSGPGVDGRNWAGAAIFVHNGEAPAVNQPPVAALTSSCTDLTCTFDGSGSSDPDGSIASYAWEFGDGKTATGAKPQHTYAAAGTYQVTLTVKDAAGATDQVTKSVAVTATPSTSSVSFVGAAAVNANATRFAVRVPADVRAGDALILFAANNESTIELGAPSGSGWKALGSPAATGIRGAAYAKVAAAADAGSEIVLTAAAYTKGDVTLLVYRGTSTTDPVAAFGAAAETVNRTTHTTPQVNGPAGWVVSYWADKTSAATSLTAPSGVTSRSATTGSGGGRITARAADSNGPVGAGDAGGLTATSDAASAKAVMFTVRLRTAG